MQVTLLCTVSLSVHGYPAIWKEYLSVLPPFTPPQEVVLQDELRDFTLESITGVYFGDYATPDLLEDVKQLLPVMTSGLISLPVRFPSPLNKLPVFGFARSMDARETLKSIILSELEKRRAAWACTDGGDRGGKSAGILDSLIEIQRNQMDLEHGRQGTFDDDFIVDNVSDVHSPWWALVFVLPRV